MTPHPHADIIRRNMHKFRYEQDGTLVWADNYGPRARKGCVAGSADSYGYLQVKLERTPIFVHRIVWAMHEETAPPQIDHINRVRTDNRIENLRAATNTSNQHNASIRKDNKSGCAGVTLRRPGQWIARISAHGKRIHLGVFAEREAAITAYLTAKEIHHAYSA